MVATRGSVGSPFIFCYQLISVIKRFVYDLLLPKGDGSSSFQPKPLDGEVEKFEVCAMISYGSNPHSSIYLASLP